MMKFDKNAPKALMLTKVFYFKLEGKFGAQKLQRSTSWKFRLGVNVLKNCGKLFNARFLKTSFL